MAEPEVLFRREGGVGIITLNRPEKYNTINPGLNEGLLRILREVDADTDIRALVLTGAGHSFCSGGDVPTFPTGEAGRAAREARKKDMRPMRERSCPLAMHECKKIIVGAINGYAVGGGLGLALACDIRIASDDARFAVIQPRRGALPDAGLTYFLPRIVGIQKALELTLAAAEGEMLDAGQALQLGLVSKVVPRHALLPEAMELARKIAAGPTIAFGLAKQGFYDGMQRSLEACVKFEKMSVTTCFGTEDCHEGVRAFLERRAPIFRGR